MNLEGMEKIEGGRCGVEIASGSVSIWGLATALSFTGVGAGFGVALGVVALGLSLYSMTRCQK